MLGLCGERDKGGCGTETKQTVSSEQPGRGPSSGQERPRIPWDHSASQRMWGAGREPRASLQARETPLGPGPARTTVGNTLSCTH